MARPLQFNREDALFKAMLLFWEKGYSDASVQSLLNEMGINRGSLYAAFGDKRQLFIESLQHYESKIIMPLCQLLRSGTNPTDTLNLFFKITFFDLNEKQLYRGCLLVNTVVELRGIDDELVAKADAIINKIASAIITLFEQAQDQGYISQEKDPKTLAALILNCINGLRVTAKQGRSKKELQKIIDATLEGFTSTANGNKPNEST